VGLPARQHRRLADIEMALRVSDPQLAALFTIFSRLHSGEEMPRPEQPRARVRRLRRRLSAARRAMMAPRYSWVRTALFFPAAVAAMIATVFVYAAFPPARCAAAHRAQRTAPVTRVVRCPGGEQVTPGHLGR
jgi:hypothetical protein